MNNFFRTIIAAYGAKKLGGGCFSTILIFFLIYWALGNCNSHPVQHAEYKTPSNKVISYSFVGKQRPAVFLSFSK